LDVDDTKCDLQLSNEKIKLLYAGNPGKSKELLKNIFLALRDLGELNNGIEFHVLGASRAQVLDNIGQEEELLNSLSNCVFVEGKVSQAKMNDIYAEHDYSIFVRPNRRSSNAGFPTKFAESLAVGTPVICNDTGDVSLYLENYKNGILLCDNSVESIINAFERIMKMSNAEKQEMRSLARLTAEKHFDFKTYEKNMIQFLRGIGAML
jgi:glycosyltransferase involved in cell wall biosynthesis